MRMRAVPVFTFTLIFIAFLKVASSQDGGKDDERECKAFLKVVLSQDGGNEDERECKGERNSSGIERNRTINPELRLYYDLFSDYSRQIRPSGNGSLHTTKVFFELSLYNILSLNTRDQKLMTNTEIVMKWSDHYLVWDPSLYNGTREIRVPYQDIWFPDIMLHNTANSGYELGIQRSNAIIKYNGEVELVSHAFLQSTCSVDTYWYPFDEQDCKMKFISWTYTVEQLEITVGVADLSEYSPNPELYLENFYAQVGEVHDACCILPLSYVTYHLQVQRRTLFSVVFLVLPGTIVNIIGLLTFLLPGECGEKVSLASNTLLAMMVFLMSVTQDIPPSQAIPLIGRYYGGCIVMLAVNISLSALTLRCLYLTSTPVPHFLRMMVWAFGHMLMVSVPEDVEKKWWEERHRSKVVKMRKDKVSQSLPNTNARSLFLHRYFDLHIPAVPLDQSFPITSESAINYQHHVVRTLDAIHLLLADQVLNKNSEPTSNSSLPSTPSTSSHKQEWHHVSVVLDRLFFVVAVVVFVIFNVILLSSSPSQEKFEYCPNGPGTCPDDWEAENYGAMLDAGSGITATHADD